MICKECNKEISKENKIRRLGYLSSICRLCSNYKNKLIQRKKAKLLKESRRW
tara:strand:- start:335 stop:490 length:156 start_codon:yes stop_codon:yes gene_type:complete